MITKYTSEAALDFHTDKDEVHHAQLTNLAAMAQSIMHQVGTTEVAQPELTTLVNGFSEGVIADAHGNLFGTISEVGLPAVFEIAKTADGYASAPTTLADGFRASLGGPNSSLIADSHGNLFGTTFIQSEGGGKGPGTVFEIVKTAHGYASTQTMLAEVGNPQGVIVDAHGNLFGTTSGGGATIGGTVFEIAKTPDGYASTPTTLAILPTQEGFQQASLMVDAHGNLFGTTAPTAGHDGTVFEIVKTAHG
jgi:hypothetical protein